MPIWTLPAASDMRGAWDYIAANNELAADRIADAIVAAADRLDRFSNLGRPGPFLDTRQFFVPKTPYKLVYRVGESGVVEILSVYHTARDWPPKSPA